MDLEEHINSIFNRICLKKNDYSNEELDLIIEETLSLNDIEDEKEAFLIIEKIAKERTSGLTEEQLSAAKRADQKWLNMSGNAYERLNKKKINQELKENNQDIEVLLPEDVKELINEQKLINNQDDLDKIINWLKNRTFDLFISKKNSLNQHVIYSVCQCKKSIRERVSRDREPSRQAMKSGFYSILISLKGDTLGSKDTKMREMFNGRGTNYKGRGWHKAYFEELNFESGIICHKKKLIEDLILESKNNEKTQIIF